MGSNGFDLSGLNERQREAVEALEGRIRVVAGAGSGKTRVLATRYAWLVEEVGIDPANILCVTFTNKAAQEMKTRIASMVSAAAHVNDFVCTIHGFCVKILRREIYRLGFPKNFTIIDEEDAKTYARHVMKELGLDRTVQTVKQFLSHIGASKGMAGARYVKLILQGAVRSDSELDKFLSLQLKNFALDFDDLIYFTLYILENFPDARDYWQKSLDFVQVDEVQDCNITDWEIIDLVSERCGNLFIVGDPDQTIYEWRGARPEEFLNFAADRTIILDRNYRSTPDILGVANSVISRNRNRIPKNLFTLLPPSETAIHFHGKSETEEADWVASTIGTLLEKGASPESFAVLYRASHSSRPFEQALIRKEIPYAVWGGIRFFERREIKDALSYLRLIEKDDDMAFARIINVPSRKFGNQTMEKLMAIAAIEDSSLLSTLRNRLSEKTFNKESFRCFVEMIDRYRGMKDSLSVSDLLDGILKDSGLRDELRRDEDEARLENLQELLSSIKLYEDSHYEDSPTLSDYLQDIALYTDADYGKDDHKVRLMTIHQSKGLEFPYVFVVGLTEGVFPSHRSIRERRRHGEEEERRLMYVAVTRAEKALFLTESEGFNYNSGTSKYPSRFLMEIDRRLLRVKGEIDPVLLSGTKKLVKELSETIEIEESSSGFHKGARVTHRLFGDGTVEENYPERGSCRVKFATKTLTLRYVALTPLSSQN